MIIGICIHHILSDFFSLHLCPVTVLGITEQLRFFQIISGSICGCGNDFSHRNRYFQVYKSFIYSFVFHIRIFFDYLSRYNLGVFFRFPSRFFQSNIYFSYGKTVGSSFKICKISRSSSCCQCCDHCSKCDSFYHFFIFHHNLILQIFLF